VIIVLFSKEK